MTDTPRCSLHNRQLTLHKPASNPQHGYWFCDWCHTAAAPAPAERTETMPMKPKEEAAEATPRQGPLCDNCGKPSRKHYCYFGGEPLTYHPSENRQETATALGVTQDYALCACPKCVTGVALPASATESPSMSAAAPSGAPMESSMNLTALTEKASQFYEANATNIVNVPRISHPEDKSGWDGVRRASEARFVAGNCPVMTLPDAIDFAATFAGSLCAPSGAEATPPRTDAQWNALVDQANELCKILRDKPDHLKCGVWANNPGSILNAYREGDLRFERAVELLAGAALPVPEVAAMTPDPNPPVAGAAQWFVSKPAKKQAIQFTGMNQRAIVETFGFGLHDKHPFRWLGWDNLSVETLEGIMSAAVGDWIIRGVEGEFYPCKDSIFRRNYEPVAGAPMIDKQKQSAEPQILSDAGAPAERESAQDFEEWAGQLTADKPFDLTRCSNPFCRAKFVHYESDATNGAWSAWQAASRRIAALQQENAELRRVIAHHDDYFVKAALEVINTNGKLAEVTAERDALRKELKRS